MWPSTPLAEESPRLSSIACYSCRRRKVKCDRKYPMCSVCEETTQVCNYPQGPLKPGPKLGSMKRPRKRPRSNHVRKEPTVLFPNDSGMPDGRDLEKTSTATPSPRRRSITAEASAEYRDEPDRLGASSDKNVKSTTQRGKSHVNIHDLSFILHPFHDISSPDQEQQVVPPRRVGQESGLQKLSSTLGLSQAHIRSMVRVYFDNMMSFNLFREPYFNDKLTDAVPTSHTYALLTSMIAYAVRFCPPDIISDWNSASGKADDPHFPSQFFLTSAFTQIDKALNECGDEPPSLCILQALIIATHCQLTHGVRGKAWRSLGTCIRLAYELNLHLVDSDDPEDFEEDVDAQEWCCKEEKRRAWWAVWEMDVFASTVRRTPPAVNWSQMKTLLPVEDEHWFSGRPKPSCFMERDPIYRWKAIHQCGNRSAKSWFLVINSLMKQAQVISSPRSVPYSSLQHGRKRQVAQQSLKTRGFNDEASQKLETLANSVRCFMLILPKSLRYRNQYLNFEARTPGQVPSTRQLHCSIYSIYLMVHLAKLMIYRYDVFRSLGSKPRREQNNQEDDTPSHEENLALTQYFEAADNILKIVDRSSDDHIKYINPYLSSTIWLASAVQIFRKEFERDETSRMLTKSKFEVLHMTYKQCVSFWNVNTALQQNLEALATQLENYRREQSTGNDVRSANEGCQTKSVSRLPIDASQNNTQVDASSNINTVGNEADANVESSSISVAFHTPPSSVKNDRKRGHEQSQ